MANSIMILTYTVLVYTPNVLCQYAKKYRMSMHIEYTLYTVNTQVHKFFNFLQIYVPVYTSVYVCVCVCVCVCVYIYIYMHTHTHTLVCTGSIFAGNKKICEPVY